MKTAIESRPGSIWWVCLVGICLVALTAVRSLPQIGDLLLMADGDDQMRLVQVRDWLAGQSWYDTTQYRILPPDGVSMHWSRYVDAGIATALTLAGTVLPAPQAELATVILWPSLLAVLMVLLLAHGTARLFGTASAIGALAVFLSWGKLGGEFVPPRIDHHNVQILCCTAIFYLSLVPGRPQLRGILAGVLTAFSLAVGLEMLPFLAALWGIVALRHAFGEDSAGTWLLGFAGAFLLAAPLLLAGQTPLADWDTDHCDVLARPVMALGAVGVVATVAQVLAGRLLSKAVARLAVLGVVAFVGLWFAWPLLAHCVAGPYAQVAPEVVHIIENNVIEALSASILLQSNPELLLRVLLPPVVLALLAMAVAWNRRGQMDRLQVTSLAQALAVVAVGLAFALLQIRAANLMTPAVPLLGGILVHAFTRLPRNSRGRLPAIIVLILAMPAVVERTAAFALRASSQPVAAVTVSRANSDCRSPAAVAEMESLPPSLIFSTLNLGPMIVAYTPHAITSAGYHRSTDAFWNGVGAFESLANLQAAVRKSNADYLVLCPGNRLEQSSDVVQRLLTGDRPSWLEDVTGDRQEVRVFRVEKTNLAGIAP